MTVAGACRNSAARTSATVHPKELKSKAYANHDTCSCWDYADADRAWPRRCRESSPLPPGSHRPPTRPAGYGPIRHPPGSIWLKSVVFPLVLGFAFSQDAGREVLGQDHVVLAEDRRMFHGVFQLPHVAGPGILQEAIQAGGVETEGRQSQVRGALLHEMPRQRKDVVLPVAQRRHVDLHHARADSRGLRGSCCRGLPAGDRGWWRKSRGHRPCAAAFHRPA